MYSYWGFLSATTENTVQCNDRFAKKKYVTTASLKMSQVVDLFSGHCTEVRFASFLSREFTTMAVMNPPEKKLGKRTSVQ